MNTPKQMYFSYLNHICYFLLSILCYYMCYLIFVFLTDLNRKFVQVDFILIIFSVIFTGISLLMSYIYAQSRANKQTDTASRALLLAQISFEKLYISIVGEENVKYETIQHMEKSLQTGRTMFLEKARKYPHLIFGMKADSKLLTQIFSVTSTIIAYVVGLFASRFEKK